MSVPPSAIPLLSVAWHLSQYLFHHRRRHRLHDRRFTDRYFTVTGDWRIRTVSKRCPAKKITSLQSCRFLDNALLCRVSAAIPISFPALRQADILRSVSGLYAVPKLLHIRRWILHRFIRQLLSGRLNTGELIY